MAGLAVHILSKTGKAEASDASMCQGIPGPQPFPIPLLMPETSGDISQA